VRHSFLVLLLALAFVVPAAAQSPQDVINSAKSELRSIESDLATAKRLERAYIQYDPRPRLDALTKKIDEALAANPGPEAQGALGEVKEEIAGKRDGLVSQFMDVVDLAKYEEHSPKFVGDVDDAIEAFHKRWGKDEKLRAVRIEDEWEIYDTNPIGEPIENILSFELAYDHDTDPDLMKLCWVSAITPEIRNSPQSGPFARTLPDDPADVGQEVISGGGRIRSSNFYLARRSNVNVGMGMGGGFGFFKIILGLACCFLFLAMAGGGAFLALKAQKKNAEVAGAAPAAGAPPGAAPGAPPMPPAG
jgi:hypothetical protein